jgi:hypothetical protein
MRGKNHAATIVSDNQCTERTGGTSMTHRILKMPRTIGLIVVVAVSAILLSAAPAFADTTPADGQYSGNLGEQAGGGGGTLPFTGMNLVLVVAAGGAIVAAGIGLRTVARR